MGEISVSASHILPCLPVPPRYVPQQPTETECCQLLDKTWWGLLLRLLWMVLPGFGREMCSLHAGGERPGGLVSLLSEVLPMRAPAALELMLHCVDPGSSMATGKMGWDTWSYWVVFFPFCDSQQEPSWGRWVGGRHNQHCPVSPNSFKQPWHKAAFELEGSKARDQLLPKGSFGERWIISTE